MPLSNTPAYTKKDRLQFIDMVTYSQAAGDFDESQVTVGAPFGGVYIKASAIKREAFSVPIDATAILLETFFTAVGDAKTVEYTLSTAGLIYGFVPLDGAAQSDIQIVTGTGNGDYGYTLKNPIMGAQAITVGFATGGVGKEMLGNATAAIDNANMILGAGQPIYTLWGTRWSPTTTLPQLINMGVTGVLPNQQSYDFRRFFDTNYSVANHKFACMGVCGIYNAWAPRLTTMLLTDHPSFKLMHRVFAVYA